MISTNNKGLSLVEILISLSIFGLLMAMLFVPQYELQKRLKRAEEKMARIVTTSEWKQRLAGTAQDFKASAKFASNRDLCPCILGGSFYNQATKVCELDKCLANMEMDFHFYEISASGPNRVAGTKTDPVFYTDSGEPCIKSDSSCAYKVESSYKASCAGALDSCDHADSLTVSFKFIPLNVREDLSEEKFSIFYPVQLNYPPQSIAFGSPVLKVGETLSIDVNGDPGHPSEDPSFVFEKCESSDEGVVEVKCYRFVNGVGHIKLTGKKVGSAIIRTQLNDGELENSLSDILSTEVQVNP